MDDTRVNIILWDTAGQEDYVGVRKIWCVRRASPASHSSQFVAIRRNSSRLRVVDGGLFGSYDNADVYFLCFSLVHPNSFHNIKSKVCWSAAFARALIVGAARSGCPS